MAEFLQVVTTASSQKEAQQIATALVDRALAACVQISGPVRSVYRWQGKVENAEEWLCFIKTSGALFQELSTAICELHSYDCPEIIATPIVDGSQDYLSWLQGQLRGS